MDRPKIQKYLEHEKYLLGISTLPDHVEAYVAHITGHRQKYHFKLYLKLIIIFFKIFHIFLLFVYLGYGLGHFEFKL